MEHIKLGSTGLDVSRLCFGTMTFGSRQWRDWVLEEDEARPLYRRAFEAGITFFDTANMYSSGGSEEITGRLLAEMAPRDRFVVATKVFFPMAEGPNQGGLSRRHIIEQCHASLKRLNTEYIDLYQIHRWDPHTPIEETILALDHLVHSGKVLYVGASSMYAWQFMRALHRADALGATRFVSMQNHYNLIYREEEREMLPLCRAEGIGVLPWSPLARGFLAGTRTADRSGSTIRAKTDDYAQSLYFQENDFAVLEALQRVAGRRGLPPAQVALAWLLHQPVVTAPIIGTTSARHLDDAVAALAIHLDAEDLAEIEAPYRPHAIAGMAQPAR